MKLTWFGGTTLRIQIGGQILVCDPDGAPVQVNARELVSGADRVFRSDETDLQVIDPEKWLPARPAAAIDAAPAPVPLLLRAGDAVLITMPGEAPLLLASGPAPAAGRWSREAVVIVAGDSTGSVAATYVQGWGPRLIALAAAESAVDATFAALRDRLGDTALVALETGLALEV